MKEFTEKHHAFIAATFYDLLTKRYGQRGEAAFILATQRYAEQRGNRKPLTFSTYREYGEWVNTQSVKDEGCGNEGYVVSYSPDFDERVTQCPWATQFAEMGMQKAGTVYCTHLDKSIVRGFNPALVYEVPQSLHEHDCCIQTARNANFPEGAVYQSTRNISRASTITAGITSRPTAISAPPSLAPEALRSPQRHCAVSRMPTVKIWQMCLFRTKTPTLI